LRATAQNETSMPHRAIRRSAAPWRPLG